MSSESLLDHFSALEDLNLSRIYAAPLITSCAAKEMSHEHGQDG